MDMMAVSLPAGRLSGTLRTLPTSPFAASSSINGFFAYSSGVRPPSSGTGSSAIPSPITRMYFMLTLPL